MPHLKKIIFTLALLLPVLALWTLRGPLNQWYSAHEGTITATLFLFSTYTLLFQALYLTNEEFYLRVCRVVLYFRPGHSFWRLTHRLETMDDRTFESLLSADSELRHQLDEVIARLAWGNVVTEHGRNYLTWTIDDRDRLTLAVDPEHNEAVLSSSKLLVPSYEYWPTSIKISAICRELENRIHPGEVKSGLEFTFATRNPYFGFFMRTIQVDVVTSFRCVFKANDSAGRGCIVTATENEMVVTGESRDAVTEVALSYLTLSARLAKGAG